VRLSHDLARTVACLADEAIKISPLQYLPEPLNLLPRQ
jgi:hypothetical protein